MQLLSKCIAGGFSAGVVLLWWPLLVPGDSLTAWLSRGVAFTLTFELLLLGLRPLEHALWATRGGKRVRTRLDALAERLGSGDTVRRLGSTAALAVVAVAVPAVLIAAGLQEQPRDPGTRRAAAPRVVRITKVVRPVKVERVVEAPPVAAAPVAAAPAPTTRPQPVRTTKPKAQVTKPQQPAASKPEAPKPQSEPQSTPDETSKQPASGSSTGTQPQLG